MLHMSILCAVDFSETSALALACAREIADHYGQPLAIVTVADPLLAAAEQMQAGRDAASLLRDALAEFVTTHIGSGRGPGQHLHVRIGDPAAEVRRTAASAHAQLLVIGTQGTTGVGQAVFGSVAERLLRTTELPVLVVPPAFAESSRHVMGALRAVVAPVDFHDHAADDARVAARVAHASHAELHLLHVTRSDELTRWSLLPPFAAAQVAEQLVGTHAAHVEQATAALQRLADALEYERRPHVHVVDGGVAEQVARFATRHPVDLVVMGLRGGADIGAPVGSVAYRVLCQSAVPVLALPATSRATQVLGFLG